MLPFTPEQFLAVFVNYNNAIWPIQIAAYFFGAIAVALLFRKTREAHRAIAGILARCGCGPALAISDFRSP